MQDGIDRIVQQLAVVADDQRGVRIFLQARFQPQRAFEVEIVGRLVEQQQIGFGEQRGGQRHPHAPAAGELRHRAVEIGVGEAKAGEDFGSARRRTVGVDGVELVINLRHLFGRGGFERGVECFAPRVGGEDRVDQRDRRRRVFLIDRTDRAPIFGSRISPPSGTRSPRIILNSVDLPTPLRPTRPTLVPAGIATLAEVEETPAPGVKNEILDPKHGAGRPK